MANLDETLIWSPQQSLEGRERHSSRPERSSSDVRDGGDSAWRIRSPFQEGVPVSTGILDGNLHIMLIIQDAVRRYSIEGMLCSLDIRVTTRCSTDIEDVATFHDGQLIISSSDASEPLPDAIVEQLHKHNVSVLMLVDSADVVGPSWVDHANGFLDWIDINPTSLRQAIFDVHSGRFHVSATLARRSVAAPERPQEGTTSKGASTISLTAREDQVLSLIAQGYSNRQIARSLRISEHGVKRVVGILLAKFNCPNRTLAVVRAMDAGLLSM